MAVVLSTAAAAAPARATTLAEALAEAFRSNPALQQQRALLVGLDEEYQQARAGLRLTLNVEASVIEHQQKVKPRSLFQPNSDVQSASTGLTFMQPLYTGGRVTAGLRAAEADILAGREGLRSKEAAVLLTVVTAYLDVMRDLKIIEIRGLEQDSLRLQLEDAEARFKAGEVTRTDVEQSRSQLQSAVAARQNSLGQLELSRAAYLAVVGQAAEQLAEPPVLPGGPATLDDAFETAESTNADLDQARFVEAASRARIVEARAQGRPSIAVQGSYGYSGPTGPFPQDQYLRNFQAQLTLTQPILSAGLVRSNIRRALAQNTGDLIGVSAVRRRVVQQVGQAWASHVAADASARTYRSQIVTAQAYFEDTVTEYKIGQRSTLDVLVAEQALRSAQIAEAAAAHDAFVASAGILQAIGRLNASALFVSLPAADPTPSLAEARNRGVMPWDRVLVALDSIGAPSPRDRQPAAAPSPPTIGEPQLRPAAEPSDAPTLGVR